MTRHDCFSDGSRPQPNPYRSRVRLGSSPSDSCGRPFGPHRAILPPSRCNRSEAHDKSPFALHSLRLRAIALALRVFEAAQRHLRFRAVALTLRALALRRNATSRISATVSTIHVKTQVIETARKPNAHGLVTGVLL